MAEVQTPTSSQDLPEYKSIEKAYGIPVVHDSLSYAHTVFSSNPYTSYFYNTTAAISAQAFDYSKPIQVRLAPLLVKADGIALSGINAVESRFPYPFQTPTEDMFGVVKAQSDKAYNTYYSLVQAPALGYAHQADAKLSPIVDRLELAVHKLSPPPSDGSSDSSTSSTDESQLSRAYRLSIQARDQIITLSSEQIKQVQEHNVLVQRAMDTIYKLNSSAQALTSDAQSRLTSISQSMHAELQKVQTSASALPERIRSSLQPLETELSQTSINLQEAIQGSDKSVSQKTSQVAAVVQRQVKPVLEAFKESCTRIVTGVKTEAEIVAPEANGNGTH